MSKELVQMRLTRSESVPSNVNTKESDFLDIENVMNLLKERKLNFKEKSPSIISLMSAVELSRFIRHGFVGKYDLPKKTLEQRKKSAMIGACQHSWRV